MQTSQLSRPPIHLKGPRERISRPVSPSPNSIILPETPPLNIKKVNPSHQPNSLVSPPNSSPRRPAPALTLSIPGSRSRPTTPKPRIQIDIPLPSNNHSADEDPYRYYGGGPTNVISSGGSADETTIRPAPTTRPVITIAMPSKQDEPIETIRHAIDNMRPTDDEVDTIPQEALLSNPWSDEFLEEICRLGEGASGAVHKVKDKRTGKIMARKTITTREAPMKQLERELLIMSSTNHINIIQFYGAYMSPSSSDVKILMDFSEGGSLETVSRRIKKRNAVVGEKIAGRLAEGILQGLAYLHAKKTIHRDIKPSNILLSSRGIVKLCDFGVSGILNGSMASTFTGTSFYMAPERICGHDYTIRSDVWSTGISLLELVQNRFPFPNDIPLIELMMYITTSEPPQLEDGGGIVWSADMKDFIKQTLTVDALSRPTPKDMLSHPWIVDNMKQEVNMAKWLRQVWEWKKPKEESRSRPGTANGHSRPPSSDSASPKAEDP
ncbi:kinase [Lentinula aciculospora]|uniref:mitogen-activated protein kinase kinase n=1 Tax=Lentinula aciculospora TaxID=153920 RepID=A0A9W9DSL7_9AGAR|nr:kinase [Lentinula aciculospora]